MPGTGTSASSRLRRAPAFWGRNPSKKKRSVGRPAATRAVMTADGPGTGVIAMPASMAA